MLKDTDLKAFLAASAGSNAFQSNPRRPSEVLAASTGLFAAEVARLCSSLEIAAVLGDAPHLAATAARTILEDIRGLTCAPLENQSAWAEAIAWANLQAGTKPGPVSDVPTGRERQAIVGQACLKLRKRGYGIEVGAYGPEIAAESRREIVRNAEGYIALLGGVETASQILRFLTDNKMYHDGMWLFGEIGLHLFSDKRPMVPVGWLFSLALRYLNKPGTARKPGIAWKSLVELATDFAATHDCQRYNQFEDINPHASHFHRMMANSILWRELFTLPQVPPKSQHQIFEALGSTLTSADEACLGFSFRAFAKEVRQLMDWSAPERLSVYKTEVLARALPILWRLTGGPEKSVNAAYGDPMAADSRSQDKALLFARGAEQVVTLPRSMIAAAVCVHAFECIWSKLDPGRAKEVVAGALERAIAEGCRGKARTILSHQEYHVGKSRYEFDTATRDGDHIVLIETKGKALTRQSRSGDIFAYFRDYSDSFLYMLSQLVNHETQLRQGHTPLTSNGEVVSDFRPIKVAVSPLSYGPVSDKFFSSSIIQSLVGAKLVLKVPDQKNQRVVDSFNQRLERIASDIIGLAPQRDGHPDFFGYLIDVFWLDLGQLLYVLGRSKTVWDAFRPLKHLTFSSRDFWTELAYADRQGITKAHWLPVPA